MIGGSSVSQIYLSSHSRPPAPVNNFARTHNRDANIDATMKAPKRQSVAARASFLHDDDSDSSLDVDAAAAATSARGLPTIDAGRARARSPSAVGSGRSFGKSDSDSDSSGWSHGNNGSDGNGSDGNSSDGNSSDGDSSDGSSGGRSRFPRRANTFTIADSRSTVDDEERREPTPHELATRVARRVKGRFRRSLPAALEEDYENGDCVAPFRTTEIVLGPLLGSGEFSHVYEIKSFRPEDEVGGRMEEKVEGTGGADNNDGDGPLSSYTPEEIETRKHMKRRERYHDTKKACYAIKHLRPKLVEEYTALEYAQSASDLANEAEFLAALQHPNIIKLRGISAAGAGGFADGPKGYFLIIDRLNETLDKRIRRWKKSRRRRNRLASSLKNKLEAKKIEAKLLLGKQRSFSIGGEQDSNGGKEHHQHYHHHHHLEKKLLAKILQGRQGGADGGGDDNAKKEGGGEQDNDGGGSEDRYGGHENHHHLDKRLLTKILWKQGGREGGGETADNNNNNNNNKDERKAWITEEQIDVGLQISSALMYLHERSVMFRDLKPQNIGFDVRGDVKLFDLGLATVMPVFGDPYENTYRMSGAGSPRYMAPEVLVDPPEEYNLKADVFTFGVVLWEMFSLESPYSHIKRRDQLVDFVVNQNGRPTINEHWPDPIKEALHLSFDPDMAKRPSIRLFYNMLRLQLLGMRDGDDTELSDAFLRRRRSKGSMRNLRTREGDADDDADDGGSRANEKFPQRVKNAVLGHVKSSPTPSSNGGDDSAPRRRRRDKLRDKFRLSIKSEE